MIGSWPVGKAPPATKWSRIKTVSVPSSEKDLIAIENIYSDDIVVWHNYDQIERNRYDSLESAKWVASEIEKFSIDECNIFPIQGGFIQQCVFRGFYKSTGKKMETEGNDVNPGRRK